MDKPIITSTVRPNSNFACCILQQKKKVSLQQATKFLHILPHKCGNLKWCYKMPTVTTEDKLCSEINAFFK